MKSIALIKYLMCCRCFLKNEDEICKIPCDETDGIPCECNIRNENVNEVMVDIPLD